MWTASLCSEKCTKLIEKELKKISAIDQISINQPAGMAILTWKPNAAFSMPAINTAIRTVGVSLRDMWLRVKGTIKVSGSQIFLISNGDGTQFELLNPVSPSQKWQSAEYNASARKPKGDLFQQLTELATKKQVVTIEGPAFRPGRMVTPVQLVVNELTP